MISNTDRLIEIIEDRTSYELALRAILETAETHRLPPESMLPIFNDAIANNMTRKALELIAGKEYE